MTVDEIVTLYNKESEFIKGTGGSLSLSRIPISDVLENRNKAYNELRTKTKEELISFIANNFFRKTYYTELIG